MGMSQEVRFKIGGDTKGLEQAFARAGQMAEQTGKRIDNAFARMAGARRLTMGERQSARPDIYGNGNGANAGEQSSSQQQKQEERNKNVFRVIGGVITAGLRSALSFTQSRQEVAQSQAESRSGELASLHSLLAARRGKQGELEQGKGMANDLEHQKAEQEKRVQFLRTPAQMAGMALDAANPFGGKGFGVLTEAEKSVEDINAKMQEQHDKNLLIQRDLDKEWNALEKQGQALGKIQAHRDRGVASELSLSQIELKRLEDTRQGEIDKKLLVEGSIEDQKSILGIETQRSEVEAIRRHAGQQLTDTNRALTEQAAEGRTFANGKKRPRSETERLADRAAMFRQRARNAILTGAKDGAAGSIEAAIGDESTVSNRLSDATSKVRRVETNDATALAPKLDTTNQLLQGIKANLDPHDL